MKKYLQAEKCKDGYAVRITTAHVISCESEIMDLIRHEGLILRNQFSKKDKKGNYKLIWAD